MKIIRKSDLAGPLLESEGTLIELSRYLCSCSHDVVINNNNNESLFDQKIKTHILCYNIN